MLTRCHHAAAACYQSIDGGASPPPSIVIQRQTSLVPFGKGDASALLPAGLRPLHVTVYRGCKVASMDIPQGTKIICSGGHEVGRVLETIPTGAPITAEKIQIDIATTAELIDSRDGHACKTFQERVTMLRGSEITIHTAWGWLGPFA